MSRIGLILLVILELSPTAVPRPRAVQPVVAGFFAPGPAPSQLASLATPHSADHR